MAQSFSRRAALGALGVTGAAGVGMLTASASASAVPAAVAARTSRTVAGWASSRSRPYFVGHRGSGDVVPEHSLEAYQAAVAWGAECIEVSVGMTSDGVLICMHDATYDRTTNATGKLASQPSTVLRAVFLSQPHLGPAWVAQPRVRVPLLETVLQTLGGRVVIALEAKNDAAYPAMMDLVDAYGLRDSVIVKIEHTNKRIPAVKNDGLPVFGYIGSQADLTPANVTALAGKLDPASDCLVVPAYGSGDDGWVPDSLIGVAVQTNVPTWVFGVHRRVDVKHYTGLGVSGFVTSSYGYVSTETPVATADTWASGAIAPGEMTKDPSSGTFSPKWDTDTGELTLAAQNRQHFLTLGQFSPIAAAAGTYTLAYEASWTTPPSDTGASLSLSFAHEDDAYYEHRAGSGTGYHAIMRADGRLGLYLHRDNVIDGRALAEVKTPALAAGAWVPLRVAVTPTTITFTRVDTGASVKAADATVRGGYLHIGRTSTDGVAAYRNFTVG